MSSGAGVRMSRRVAAGASRGAASDASRGASTDANRGGSARLQFTELAKTHARTVLRERSAVIALLVSFVGFLALFGGLDLLIGQAIGGSPGLLRTTLGVVAVTSFLAVALLVTAVPLIDARGRGVFRQLATTPAIRVWFLLAHLPVRVAILAAEIGILLVVARIACGVTGWVLVQVAVTLVLGAALLLGFGYLVATRLANVELARQLAYLIPMLVLASSGAMFPLDGLPDALRSVLLVLPTTWFVATLNAQLGVGTEMLDPVLAWGMMLAAAAGMAAAAAYLFRWTAGE